MIANGLPHDRTPDLLCDNAIKNRAIPTHQTVSRLAGYLHAERGHQERFNLDKVKLPRTYVIGLDQDFPENVNDDNVIVIQIFIQEKRTDKPADAYLVVTADSSLKACTISPEHVRQIGILAIYNPFMWDIKDNLFFDIGPMQFVYTDFEQPDATNPVDSFCKKDGQGLGLSHAGRDKVCELFSNVPGLEDICQRLRQLTDDQLMQIASGTLPASIATPIK